MGYDERRRARRTLGAAVIIGCGWLGGAAACGSSNTDSPEVASPDADTPRGAEGGGDTGVTPSPEAGLPGDATVQGPDAGGAVSDADAGLDADAAADGDGGPLEADSAEPQDSSDGGVDRDAPEEPDAMGAFDGPDAMDAPDESDAQQSPDADGGLSATETLIVNARDMACLACAQQHGCLGTTCESLVGQVAAAGPEAGAPRAQLCLDTLACLLQSKCYDDGVGASVCICGLEFPSMCTASGPATLGADCVAIEQAGLETTDAGAELDAQSNGSLGAGVANAILLCSAGVPCPTCL
jgi:hypothetical protein